MKILIVADLEGVSGIVNERIQALPGSPLYSEARNFLMSDLNSAIEGAKEGGAADFIVLDSHCDGLNILLDKLNISAEAILGNPILIPEEYIREFDAKILIGYHSMAETKNSILPHTYPLEIKHIEVNGLRVGEIGMEILIAAYLDIPTILVTGDSKAEIEARQLINDINFVTVKDSLAERSGTCKNLYVTSKMIKESAKNAVQNYKNIGLLKLNSPYKIEISFYSKKFARKVFKINKFYKKEIIGNRIIAEHSNLYKLWTNLKDSIWMNL